MINCVKYVTEIDLTLTARDISQNSNELLRFFMFYFSYFSIRCHRIFYKDTWFVSTYDLVYKSISVTGIWTDWTDWSTCTVRKIHIFTQLYTSIRERSCKCEECTVYCRIGFKYTIKKFKYI